MKKAIILFMGLLIFGCSSDDDSKENSNGGNIPANEKLLGTYVSSESINPVITYNDDKTVKRLVFGDNTGSSILYDFRYANGVVSEVFVILGGESATFSFEHQNGIITGFHSDYDDQIIPVTYNAVTKAYSYTDDNNDDYLIDLTADGDIEKYSSDDNSDFNFICLYVDEPNKFGPMANANSIHAYLLMTIPEIIFFTPLISKKPIDIFSSGQFATQFKNEYYKDGFVKKTTFNQEEGVSTIEYKYTSLQSGN